MNNPDYGHAGPIRYTDDEPGPDDIIVDQHATPGYFEKATDPALISDIGGRRLNTKQLRKVLDEGERIGFNRTLPWDELPRNLDHNGVHVLQPIMVHRFINQEPADEHIRCVLLVKTYTRSEPYRFTVDVTEKTLRGLTRIRTKRGRKADPTWDLVLEMYADLYDTTKTNPARVDIDPGTGRNVDTALPLSLLQPLDPWFVSADMVTLTSAAAAGMPSQTLNISDLVTTSGFAVLEEPLFVDSPQWGIVPIRALVWRLIGPSGLPGWPGSAGRAPSVACVAFMDLEHEDSTDDITAPGYRSRLWPVELMLWPEGEAVEAPTNWANLEPGVELDMILTLRKFYMALWLLSGQRVAGVTGQKPARQQRRRMERLELPSTVMVVRLRRESAPRYDDDHEPTKVNWSHRWVVTGHWVRRWNEKQKRTTLYWRGPFIKGPDDKPLVIKDRIIKFER